MDRARSKFNRKFKDSGHTFFDVSDNFCIFQNGMAKRLRFLLGLNKRSCGKVMFLHLSVILFTGGSLFRGFSVQGGLCPGVSLSRGSLSSGSLSRAGRGSLWGGGEVFCPGGSLSWRFPWYDGRADSTHPTGMHSCF